MHVDVMDNHFVPNLTIGVPVVASLRRHAVLPLDCHLMIEEPDRWAVGYAEAGARNVTFHAEALPTRWRWPRTCVRPGRDRARRSTVTLRSRATWSCCPTSTCC